MSQVFSREVRLPALTDSLQRLLSLSPADRSNLGLLELLALRDPVAVSRLLVLVNSAAFSRGVVVRNLSDAVFRLGAKCTYDALLSIWVVESLSKETGSQDLFRSTALRIRLAAHLTSLCVTCRRIHESLDSFPFELVHVQSDAVMAFSVQLLALCKPADDEDRQQLSAVLQKEEFPLLLQDPPVPHYTQAYLVDLARYWGADPTRVEHLRDWALERRPSGGLCMALLAEFLVHHVAAGRKDSLPQLLRESCLFEACRNLAETIVYNGISPASLVVRF